MSVVNKVNLWVDLQLVGTYDLDTGLVTHKKEILSHRCKDLHHLFNVFYVMYGYPRGTRHEFSMRFQLTVDFPPEWDEIPF